MEQIKEVMRERDLLVDEHIRIDSMLQIFAKRKKSGDELTAAFLKKEWGGKFLSRGLSRIEVLQQRYFRRLIKKIEEMGKNVEDSVSFEVNGREITATKLEDQLEVYAHDIIKRASQYKGSIAILLRKKKTNLDELKVELDKLNEDVNAMLALLEHLTIKHDSITGHSKGKLKINQKIDELLERRDVDGLINLNFLKGYRSETSSEKQRQLKASEYRALVQSIPNYETLVLDYYKWRLNPVLYEVFSIYSSVVYNAGLHYGKRDVFLISTKIVFHVFVTLKSYLSKMRPGSFLPKECDVMLTVPHTILLLKTSWKLFYGASVGEKELQVLEVLRKKNPDKGGYNKYRFRETVIYNESSLESTHDMYSPAEHWWAFEWHINPNEWTKKMRKCIQGSLKFLFDNGINSFCIAEGGAFKGTAIHGSDTDATAYIFESQRNEKLENAANNRFKAIAKRLGVWFKEELRFHYIDDKDKILNLAELHEMKKVLKGIEKGLYLADYHKEYFIKKPVVIDLVKFRTTGRVHFVS